MFKFLEDIIKLAIPTKTPVLLWGERGVGKTEFTRNIVEELGYHYRIIRTAGKEDTDFSGIPVEIDGRTVYASPEWMPFEEWECSKCGATFGEPYSKKPNKCPKCGASGKNIDHYKIVLIFDEINRGNDEVLQSLFEFVADRSFDGRKFASETAIIATANPAGGSGYIVNAFDDEAFLSRWSHIGCGVDNKYFDEWYTYLLGKLDPTVVQRITTYIGQDRSKLLGKSDSDGWGFTVKPSPRSWTWALKVYDYGIKNGFKKDVIIELMGGLVGRGIANEFYNITVKLEASRVIKKWNKEKDDIKNIIDKLSRPEVASLIGSVVNEALLMKVNKQNRENVLDFLLYVGSTKKKSGNRDLVASALYKLISAEYPNATNVIHAHELRQAIDNVIKKTNDHSVKPWTALIVGNDKLNKFVESLYTEDVVK